MNGNDLYPQLARFFQKGDAGVFIVEPEAFPIRAPLGVGFPRGNAPVFGQLVHGVQVAVLVGVYPAVQKQAVCALHLLDDLRRGGGFLDGQGLGIGA